MISWKKNKTKINLTIDAIMFLALMAIAGLGFLIKYVLIPGYKRNVIYRDDVELFFMGLTRHEWGKIHLILGFLFLFLLLLHVILHWNMIGSIFRNMFSSKTTRIFIAISFGIAGFLLLISPLTMKPEIVPSQGRHIHQNTLRQLTENESENQSFNKQKVKKETIHNHGIQESETERIHKHEHHEIEVYGYMTLNQLAKKYDLNVSALTHALNIPASVTDSKIGHLRKRYGFHNNEIREAILKIKGR